MPAPIRTVATLTLPPSPLVLVVAPGPEQTAEIGPVSGWREPPASPAALSPGGAGYALPGRLLFRHLIRPGFRRGVARIHALSILPVHVLAALAGRGRPRRHGEQEGHGGKRHTKLDHTPQFLHFVAAYGLVSPPPLNAQRQPRPG